jgi:hypothetical protein
VSLANHFFDTAKLQRIMAATGTGEEILVFLGLS